MFQVALVGRRSGRQLALSNPSSCLSTYTAPPPPPPLSLKPNELSFGMDKLEFEFRRLKLVSRLPPHSTVILAGYGLRYISNAGIFYPFHQSTDFAYLTGFNEPDAALVLERDEGLARRYRFTMFCKPRNKSRELWDGPVVGLEGAIDRYGADDARNIEEFPEFISQLLAGRSSATASSSNAALQPIYSDLPLSDIALVRDREAMRGQVEDELQATHHIRSGRSGSGGHAASATSTDHSITSYVRNMLYNQKSKRKLDNNNKNNPHQQLNIHALAPQLQELRVIKSEAELGVMRTVGSLSGKAFQETMQHTSPNSSEHYLSSVIEFGVKKRGAFSLAYVPVVAGGKRALTLHYVKNNEVLKDGEMVLMDAGGLFGGYCADITRTWPANGVFSQAQRHVYELVLAANKQGIQKCNESSGHSLNSIHSDCAQMIRQGCERLFNRRICTAEVNDILFPHHIGHYLGMDVHDTGLISRSRRLQQGMVVTIEPGLYIPDSPRYPEQFRGIGIRIEDDVAVGESETSSRILTIEAPKEVDEIQDLMASFKSIN